MASLHAHNDGLTPLFDIISYLAHAQKRLGNKIIFTEFILLAKSLTRRIIQNFILVLIKDVIVSSFFIFIFMSFDYTLIDKLLANKAY